MNEPEMGETLSVAKVARHLSLSRSAVYRAITDGELEAMKVRGQIRVEPRALEDFKERCRIRPRSREPISFQSAAVAHRESSSDTFAARLAKRRAA